MYIILVQNVDSKESLKFRCNGSSFYLRIPDKPCVHAEDLTSRSCQGFDRKPEPPSFLLLFTFSPHNTNNTKSTCIVPKN